MGLKYEEVAIPENSNKFYWCTIIEDDEEALYALQLHDSCNSNTVDMVFYHSYEDSNKEFRKEDILNILEECVISESDDLDTDEDPNGEFTVDHEAIKHLYHESDVYRFNNKDELILLYKSMNDPMISGVWSDDTYIDKLDEDVFGVVFYWTEYDDWSCGHPYSYHMKIIFGVK